MECNDEAVERQKLVPNECDEDDQNTITNISSSTGPQKSQISPVPSNKVFSSSDTSRSQNSTSCSIGKGNTDSSGLPSARLIYVNERKAQDCNPKIDYKSKARRIQRDQIPTASSSSASNLSQTQNQNNNYNFSSRPLKHHSFTSEVPDVRHMERALLGLLEDFHSGKLRAFGSGCSMEQMTNIREQQERLAKLHFDLGSSSLDPFTVNETQSQENMTQLVQKLEQLSVSIEKLHSSNVEI